ncbi:tetratricopeptide repeat protein 19, mitochondrial-like [Mya arenaria]|uniref:tetratricopeptide repeat protein 19, mitochondrial-like n=1 Tax=Mya arenaria TaxID=6604 RepID=UPI0022DED64E|nr:tetratricopeptide repeat protein 19, mitochondrial-like [Mya arenaria]
MATFGRFAFRRISAPSRQVLRQLSNKSNGSQWTQYFRKSRLPWLGPIGAGVTLGFLGLFNTEEVLTDKEKIQKIVARGKVACQNQQFDQAREAFHEALRTSSDFKDEKKITENEHLNHRVYIYDQIANMLLDTGDFENAEKVFKDTMKLAVALGMALNDNAMIEMSLKLATIYLYTGRFNLGVEGVRYCIDEQEKKLQDPVVEKKDDINNDSKQVDTKALKEENTNTRVLLGKAYRHHANFYMQQRHFKEAKDIMVKALEMSRSALGTDDDNSFVIMNDIATCDIMLKDFKGAEMLLKEGIAKSGKAKSLIQSAFYSNLGALYIRTQKYEEAEHACRSGLTIAKRHNDQTFIMPCKACLVRLAQIHKSILKKEEEED